MELRNQDMWLLAGLGILGYFAARIAHRQLIAVRTAAQITQDDRPQDILSRHTQNALKLETLGQLTQSANQNIRNAAVKIITERATRGAVLDLMLQDIAGGDTERRDKALTTLRYLCVSPAVGLGTHKGLVPDYPMFKAIIDCLCTWLPAVQKAKHADETKFPYRSQPERDALKILSLLLENGVALGLQAGVIVRWLANCNFDNHENSEAGRKAAIQEMLKWECDDLDMCDIINALVKNNQALEQLESHGLVENAAMEKTALDSDMEDIWVVRNRSTIEVDRGPDSVPLMRRGRRVREESLEEQALRRRRREAMVIGQEGRAVQRDDIIERDNTLSDEDGDHRMVDDVREAEAEGDQTWWNWRPWSVLRAGLVEQF